MIPLRIYIRSLSYKPQTFWLEDNLLYRYLSLPEKLFFQIYLKYLCYK